MQEKEKTVKKTVKKVMVKKIGIKRITKSSSMCLKKDIGGQILIRKIWRVYQKENLIVDLKGRGIVVRTREGFAFAFTPFSRSFMKVTAMAMIILINWTWISLIGGTMAYLNDTENSQSNDFTAGDLDFELSSDSDFTPSSIISGGSAVRTINVVNFGNPFKYVASSTDFSGPVCPYLTLEANINDGSTEYSGPLLSFLSNQHDFSDPTAWNFKLILATNTPFALNGQACDFNFEYFGSQLRHDLSLGKGFYDFEKISNHIVAEIPEELCYGSTYASGSPILAKLHNGTIVTDKVKNSDNIRAFQSVSGIKYIYLDWVFTGLPANASTTSAKLTLEHRESDVDMSVQWWNGLSWIEVCDPGESISDIISTCDLKSFINNTDKAGSVRLRLKLSQNGSCHEELDWANLEIAYENQVECDVCGNGILDEGNPSTGSGQEECDDGNTADGDGCDSLCQEECSIAGIAIGMPALAKLDSGTVVTYKVSKSDNQYAEQSVSQTKYIYLDWTFANLPADVPTNLANLYLEHRENDVLISIEWFNGLSWLPVCDPEERGVDSIDTCDLLSFIDNTDKAGAIKIRLKLYQDGSCHEYLDWAQMEIGWYKKVPCAECGNGIVEETDPSTSSGQETCDDGNQTDDDGCGSACQIEDPAGCMKINEVYYDPDTCHGNERDEWIELYNACDFTVDLKDWYMLDNGGLSDKEKINQTYPIEPHSFVVLADNAQTWTFWPLIPNQATKIALGGNRLFRGLGNGGDRLFLYEPSGNLADAMSYGADTSVFDPSALDVLKGHSLSRTPAGFDSDSAADWFDIYGGSTPPGPNPGTNPHDADGNLLVPTGDDSLCCEDYGIDTTDNSDELETNPDLAVETAISVESLNMEIMPDEITVIETETASPTETISSYDDTVAEEPVITETSTVVSEETPMVEETPATEEAVTEKAPGQAETGASDPVVTDEIIPDEAIEEEPVDAPEPATETAPEPEQEPATTPDEIDVPATVEVAAGSGE